MQNVVTLPVEEEGIRPTLHEEVDHIVMTPLRGPHSRRSVRLASSGIDIGTGFDEELAGRILVVDCCPLDKPVSHTTLNFDEPTDG